MFDRIASRYDVVNSVLSGGQDRPWRRAAAAASRLKRGGTALDVACGSGRLTAELAVRAGREGHVVGLDFSSSMLRRARRDHPSLAFARGDALNLPFRDAAFDAVTMAFGLRNLAQPVGGLREMFRVLRPHGRAVVLEFVRPRPGLVGAAYGLYLRRVLPAVGGLVSGDAAAYRYLSETVDSYHSAEELAALATGSGWSEPELRLLTFGTVAIVAAIKR